MNFLRTLTVFLGLGMMVNHAADASVIPTPADLNPGDSYYVLFVSSGLYQGDFGGLPAADALVQGLADSAGIGSSVGVTWQALLSDTATDAISRFNPSVPIYRMDGSRLANSGTDFWDGTFISGLPGGDGIRFDEFGTEPGGQTRVWTGTTTAGVFAGNPSAGWTSNSSGDLARTGDRRFSNSAGLSAFDLGMNRQHRLYAFSSELTIDPVPAPTGFALLPIAALAVGFRLRRRRTAD